jgi:phosphotransferase family enzyme
VLVHLRPAPVVARVMTATAALHGDVRGWLAREVAVGEFLGAAGAPVAPPSDLVPPGPHSRDDLWITFWRYVEHDPDRGLDPVEAGRSLRELHAALATYPGSAPPFTEAFLDIARLTGGPAPVVPATSLPAQVLHGDASIGNLLLTTDGPLWSDLEDTCTGPVEWDLAGLVASARVRGHDERFVAGLVSGHGGDLLESFVVAHDAYSTTWGAYFSPSRSAGP